MTNADLNKLKPCPFCGKEPVGPDTEGLFICLTKGCPVRGSFTLEEWNTRPIEDKLREAVEAAERERDAARKRSESLIDGIKHANGMLLDLWAKQDDNPDVSNIQHHLMGTITDENGNAYMTELDAARKELAEIRKACHCNCHQPWWTEQGNKPHANCGECFTEILDEEETVNEGACSDLGKQLEAAQREFAELKAKFSTASCARDAAEMDRDHTADERDTAVRELEELKAKLPKTADGVAVVPGMTTYCGEKQHSPFPHRWDLRLRDGQTWKDHTAKEPHYSTREAAEEALAAKGGTSGK